MKCPYCGAKIHGGFCPQCGALVAGQKALIGFFSKSFFKRWWFWVLAALAAVVTVFSLGGDSMKLGERETSMTDKTAANAYSLTTDLTATTTDEYYDKPVKIYDLSAGIYTAGIDIPAGICNVAAVSGNGNLYSSNAEGGINALFGIDHGDGTYLESFYRLNLPKFASLTVTSNLKVRLLFTSTVSGYVGRRYDETVAVTLGSGSYTSGTDFPSGTYQVKATSGSGSVISSNPYGNGINEMLSDDDGSGAFNDSFLNVELPEGVVLTVSEGLTVQLVPAV